MIEVIKINSTLHIFFITLFYTGLNTILDTITEIIETISKRLNAVSIYFVNKLMLITSKQYCPLWLLTDMFVLMSNLIICIRIVLI